MPKIVNDETVYRAAMQTVIDRGYAGATTKQIADAAGISEVTLFRKYGNKAELVRQAIADRAAQIDLDSAAAYTGDVTADLLRVVETYQGTAARDGQFFYAVMSEVGRTSDLVDALDSPLAMMGQVRRSHRSLSAGRCAAHGAAAPRRGRAAGAADGDEHDWR